MPTAIGENSDTTPAIAQFFAGHPESQRIFEAVRDAVAAFAPAELRVTKSQIAFRHQKPFAWAWRPDQYLGGKHAPLVLTLAFRHRDPSPRWKEIVEPAPGHFTHHLELRSAAEVDDEVQAWLRAAWALAG